VGPPRRSSVALTGLSGDSRLFASLMCGAGLRPMECLRLRVQDIDFPRNEIHVRDGKCSKARVTMLPESAEAPLQDHLARVREVHQRDLAKGCDRVFMPYALEREYPNAASEWGWQWVFPQENRWLNPQTGEQGRHHVDESIVQKAVKAAVRNAGIVKPATCHTHRHSGVYPALVRDHAPARKWL